jgi:hypothetical protein
MVKGAVHENRYNIMDCEVNKIPFLGYNGGKDHYFVEVS